MGSKLTRRNKALKKLQPPDKDRPGEHREHMLEDTLPSTTFMPGRYRMVSKEDHFVILHANSVHHSRHRWPEFYPNVPVEGVTITFLGN